MLRSTCKQITHVNPPILLAYRNKQNYSYLRNEYLLLILNRLCAVMYLNE